MNNICIDIKEANEKIASIINGLEKKHPDILIYDIGFKKIPVYNEDCTNFVVSPLVDVKVMSK